MIDDDDLALLAASFDGALRAAGSAEQAEADLRELGWVDLLAADPVRGAVATFALLGHTGSPAALLDDVLATALGAPLTPGVCVLLPAPHGWLPPGRRDDGGVTVDGLVTTRIHRASAVLVPVRHDGGAVSLAVAEASSLLVGNAETVDTSNVIRRVRGQIADSAAEPVATWPAAVDAARLALSAQLLGAARAMLAHAVEHAIGRAQFGRSIASFQAVRHKLAESLVAIEGAAAALDAAVEQPGALSAAVAKSLAGKASRITAAHAQQVLAGVGFTTEHPFHRWLKRTMVLDTLFGSATTLPTDIGRRLLAAGGAPRLVEL